MPETGGSSDEGRIIETGVAVLDRPEESTPEDALVDASPLPDAVSTPISDVLPAVETAHTPLDEVIPKDVAELLAPYIKTDADRANVVDTYNTFMSELDGVQVTGANTKKYFTPGQEVRIKLDKLPPNAKNIHKKLQSESWKISAEEANTWKFRFLAEAIAKRESPDMADFLVAKDVITSFPNTYVRNTALRKLPDLIKSIPNVLTYVADDVTLLKGNIGGLYERFLQDHPQTKSQKGAGIVPVTRPEFAFMFPYLLDTDILTRNELHLAHAGMAIQKTRSKSDAYRISELLVDVYDPKTTDTVKPLMHLASVYNQNPQYWEDVEKRRDAWRKRNLPDVNVLLTRTEIARAGRRMQENVLSSLTLPELVTYLKRAKQQAGQTRQDLPEDSREAIRVEELGTLLDIADEAEGDKDAFLLPLDTDDIAFLTRSVWKQLKPEEQERYWNAALAQVQEEITGTELSPSTNVYDAIEKLMGLRVVSSHHFKKALGSVGELASADSRLDGREVNRVVDEAQITTFKHMFSRSKADMDFLRSCHLPVSDANLFGFSDEVQEAYRNMGSFNDFFVLYDRYADGVKSRKPDILQGNLLPLFKQAVVDMMNGTFDTNRRNQTKTILGATFDPLRIQEETDPQRFARLQAISERWDGRDADDSKRSATEQTQELPSLREIFLFKQTNGLPVLRNPLQYLRNYATVVYTNPELKGAIAKYLSLQEAHKAYTASYQEMFSAKDGAELSKRPKHEQEFYSFYHLLSLGSMLDDVARDDDSGIKTREAYAKFFSLYNEFNRWKPKTEIPTSKDKSKETNAAKTQRFFTWVGRMEREFKREQLRNIAQEDMTVTVTDSSHPIDLLRVGKVKDTLTNCMNVSGDPEKNVQILDFLYSRNKKVIQVARDGEPAARAVLKMLHDPITKDPILLIDDLLSDSTLYTYKSEIINHLKDRFEGLGLQVAEPIGYVYPNAEMDEVIAAYVAQEHNNETMKKRLITEAKRRGEVHSYPTGGEGSGSVMHTEMIETGPDGTPREVEDDIHSLPSADFKPSHYQLLVEVVDIT